MISRTHIVGENAICQRCGMAIPDPRGGDGKRLPLYLGDSVGVIQATAHTEAVSYLVGEHDSNLPCNPAPEGGAA